MNEHSVNVLESYGKWVAECPSAWESAAIDSAHRQLVDTVAVLLPGAMEPSSRTVLATVVPWSYGVTRGANVAGIAYMLPGPWAALANGTAAHALDFDDNFDPPKAHASAVLFPALLALADTEGVSGTAVLDAYIVGLQIMGRVGQGVNPVHRNRGWHATATVGVIGVAAGCARLLQLDGRQCAHALSLATSMSAGFMSQFGTMAKSLHAGLAAKGGVLSAVLAKNGMQAGRHTLDGPAGMNTLMVGPDREQLKQALTGAEHGQTLNFETENIGSPLHITEYGFRVKRFPNCGSAHRAMDLLLETMDRHALAAEVVEKIEVHAPKSHLDNLFYHHPETGLEAKFSMEYALACLLETGNCTLLDFTDQAVARPSLRARFGTVELHPIDALESGCPTRLVVTDRDKKQYELSASMPRGSLTSPFSWDDYWTKFDTCAGSVLNPAQAAVLRKALEGFPELRLASDMTRYYAINYIGDLGAGVRN